MGGPCVTFACESHDCESDPVSIVSSDFGDGNKVSKNEPTHRYAKLSGPKTTRSVNFK